MTALRVSLPEDIAVAILESLRGYRSLFARSIAGPLPWTGRALAGLDREISILSDAITAARIDAQVRAEMPPTALRGTPHAFSYSGGVDMRGERLCSCALEESHPIHGRNLG